MDVATTALCSPATSSIVLGRPTNGSPVVRFGSNFRFPAKLCTSASIPIPRQGHRRGRLSVGSRRGLVVRATSSPESPESNNKIAPLRLESPVGQFLSQILVNHPHLVPAAVDQQLELLQTDRDADQQKQDPSSTGTGTDLVLYRVSKELYAPALGGIMLSIGIRLSMDDFALAFKRPLPLSLGLIAQYVPKPVLGVLIAKAFGLPRMFYAGFVLTACVSGAQLSSYANFISKGDVALCILLTSYITIASVIVTPLLTGLLIGSVVPVDAVAMSKSILQVVLVPATLGLLLNTYAKPVVSLLRPVMPFVAMFCTSICIGSPLAINRSQILSTQLRRFPI